MLLATILAAFTGFTFLAATSAQDTKPGATPAAKLVAPVAYYASDETLKNKVRLSDEMAAKLVEILGRKPRPWERTLRVAPRGYFVVGGKSYAYFSFLTSDPSKGESWGNDPALTKFWEELNRVNDELAPLRDFKP